MFFGNLFLNLISIGRKKRMLSSPIRDWIIIHVCAIVSRTGFEWPAVAAGTYIIADMYVARPNSGTKHYKYILN